MKLLLEKQKNSLKGGKDRQKLFKLAQSEIPGTVYFLMLGLLCVVLDFSVMLPLGPSFLSLSYVSTSSYSNLLAVYCVLSALSGFGVSFLTRFYSAPKLLVMSLGCLALSSFMTGFAGNLLLLFVARAIAGFSGGAIRVLAFKLLSDTVPRSRRGEAGGIMSYSSPLVGIVGLPLGLFLEEQFGLVATYGVLGGMIFVVAVSCLFGFKKSLFSECEAASFDFRKELSGYISGFKGVFEDKRAMNSLTLYSAVVFSGGLVLPFINTYFLQNGNLSSKLLPTIFCASGFIALCCTKRIGRLSDKIGLVKVLTFISSGHLAVMFCLLTLGFLLRDGFQISFLLGFALLAIHQITAPCRNSLALSQITKVGKTEYRPNLLSLAVVCRQLATAFSAFLSGLMVKELPNGSLMHFESVVLLAIILSGIILVSVNRFKIVDYLSFSLKVELLRSKQTRSKNAA